MMYITDIIGEVVDKMRPLGAKTGNNPIVSDYGSAMAEYLTETRAKTENLTLMPYYMYGHRMEINSRLVEKDQDKVYKYQKYPLVALRMDITETFVDGVIEFNLNIGFFCFTEKDMNAEERMTEIFYPVLIPMYERFMQELRNDGRFMWNEFQDNPPHTRILRPFWGTETLEGNVKHIFSDPLDCVEVTNLRLRIEKELC